MESGVRAPFPCLPVSLVATYSWLSFYLWNAFPGPFSFIITAPLLSREPRRSPFFLRLVMHAWHRH